MQPKKGHFSKRTYWTNTTAVYSTAPKVAVLLCGYLNVSIPEAGATTRRFLIEPLQADVFVAGTATWEDCSGVNLHEPRQLGDCLLERLEGLRPITSLSISPMLTITELRERVSRAALWSIIEANYSPSRNPYGLNVFAPVLGNPGVSCLREIIDYHHVYRLMKDHEDEVGAAYDRVVFSRLEAAWAIPHPPLSLLDPHVIWVQSGQRRAGVNDRYALMPRQNASVYFGRWRLILSDQLFKQITKPISLTADPEGFLRQLLISYGIKLGELPAMAWLSCCNDPGKCWTAAACYAKPLLAPSDCPEGTSRERQEEGAEPLWRRNWRSTPDVARLLLHRSNDSEPEYRAFTLALPSKRTCQLGLSKYELELEETRRYYQMLQCPHVMWRAQKVADEDDSFYTRTLDVVLLVDVPRRETGQRASFEHLPTRLLSPRLHLVHKKLPGGERDFVQQFSMLRRRSNRRTLALAPTLVSAWRNERPITSACILHAAKRLPASAVPLRGICRPERKAIWDTAAFPECQPITESMVVRSGMSDIDECALRCAKCAQCTHVSFSKYEQACEWFQSCPRLDPPGKLPSSFWDMESVNARQFVRVSPIATDSLRFNATLGFCAVTIDGDHGDCDRGDEGMLRMGFGLGNGSVPDVAACVAFCRSCKRCNFVSVSYTASDCSWYHECDRLRAYSPLHHRTIHVIKATSVKNSRL